MIRKICNFIEIFLIRSLIALGLFGLDKLKKKINIIHIYIVV